MAHYSSKEERKLDGRLIALRALPLLLCRASSRNVAEANYFVSNLVVLRQLLRSTEFIRKYWL